MFLLRCTWLFLLAISIAHANISPQDMANYKHSWLAQTLQFQRAIDMNAPLNEATFIGTHNSENAVAYQIPFVRYVDPNQQLSIYDQLEVGVRSIEFDVHWYNDLHFSKDILLCHGLNNHVGCSVFDRPVKEGLAEMKTWLSENPGEVVILYFDKTLDGHEPRLAAYLNEQLGQFIYKPKTNSAHSCQSLEPQLRKADILAAHKQLVIITKRCDETAYQEQDRFPFYWNDYVYAGMGHSPNNEFNFLDSSYGADFNDFPSCAKQTVFVDDPAHENVWRIFEDRTILSSIGKPTRKLYAQDVKNLLRCNINWPTLDMLILNDDRLTAMVWTWAQGYPKQDLGVCIYAENNVGMKNAPCNRTLSSFACQNSEDKTFALVNMGGTWDKGEDYCQSKGPAWHFSMPLNAGEMYRLNALLVPNQEVWLNHKI